MDHYPAHIRIDSTRIEHIQSSAEHCRHVAKYTGDFLEPLCLSRVGVIVGLLHDAGKFTHTFSTYITMAAHGEKVKRGSVKHTFAGVRLLLERYYDPSGQQPFRNLACDILAFSIGSHHGMFDCIDPDGHDGFLHRLETEDIDYGEAKSSFLSLCTDEATLDKLFESAVRELKALTDQCKQFVSTQDDLLFVLSLVCRLILSAVIDADRRDTAEFMHDFHIDPDLSDMRPIWRAQLDAVEQKLNAIPVKRPVDTARRIISDRCLAFPVSENGIYRLSVPTGSGKTLTSLRFSLAAANRYNKSRILFVTPLLSVLEQNAKAIHDNLGGGSLILEHHSNVVRTENTADELDENELLTETWRSPIVITTLVQLLNTLFDGGTTCIRRLHALTNSVIILDEVQSVPRHMLSQFNLALNFLARVCNAIIVLSSATQPCFEEAVHRLCFSAPDNLIPYDPLLWEPFRRTTIIDRRKPGGFTYDDLAGFALDLLPEAQSVLLICNKKEQAVSLYQRIRHAKAHVFHLSTNMCMAHRIKTLQRIKLLLGNGPVICVATQMVEAGVDFSFGRVIRVSAGMDSVIQAAGRCNRSGEFHKLCPVYIVNLQEEDLSRLPEIRDAQKAAEELLSSFSKDGKPFLNDLQSTQAIQYYYRRLFANMPSLAQDYPVPRYHTTLLKMLSFNQPFRAKGNSAHWIGQAFRTAGEEFKVFDDNRTDVLVPYGQGADIIADLDSARAQSDFLYCRKCLDVAKKYSVSLFDYQVRILSQNNGLHSLCAGAVLAILPAFYNDETGMDLCGKETSFEEV